MKEIFSNFIFAFNFIKKYQNDETEHAQSIFAGQRSTSMFYVTPLRNSQLKIGCAFRKWRTVANQKLGHIEYCLEHQSSYDPFYRVCKAWAIFVCAKIVSWSECVQIVITVFGTCKYSHISQSKWLKQIPSMDPSSELWGRRLLSFLVVCTFCGLSLLKWLSCIRTKNDLVLFIILTFSHGYIDFSYT